MRKLGWLSSGDGLSEVASVSFAFLQSKATAARENSETIGREKDQGAGDKKPEAVREQKAL